MMIPKKRMILMTVQDFTLYTLSLLQCWEVEPEDIMVISSNWEDWQSEFEAAERAWFGVGNLVEVRSAQRKLQKLLQQWH